MKGTEQSVWVGILAFTPAIMVFVVWWRKLRNTSKLNEAFKAAKVEPIHKPIPFHLRLAVCLILALSTAIVMAYVATYLTSHSP